MLFTTSAFLYSPGKKQCSVAGQQKCWAVALIKPQSHPEADQTHQSLSLTFHAITAQNFLYIVSTQKHPSWVVTRILEPLTLPNQRTLLQYNDQTCLLRSLYYAVSQTHRYWRFGWFIWAAAFFSAHHLAFILILLQLRHKSGIYSCSSSRIFSGLLSAAM